MVWCQPLRNRAQLTNAHRVSPQQNGMPVLFDLIRGLYVLNHNPTNTQVEARMHE